MKLFKEVKKLKDNTCPLQDDLDKLYERSKDWLLTFHPRIGQTATKMSCTMLDKDRRHTLANTEAERDLGVFINRKITFKNHIAHTTAKTNPT